MDNLHPHPRITLLPLDIDEVVDNGNIKQASKLGINPEEETDYDRGLVYEKIPEILTRGNLISRKRVAKIEERDAYAKYLILLTAYPFTTLVTCENVLHCILFYLKVQERKRSSVKIVCRRKTGL